MRRTMLIVLLAACGGADDEPPPESESPSIAVQPTDVSVVEPSTATFAVTADGEPPLTYRWERRRAGETDFTPIDIMVEPAAGDTSYVTPPTQATDDMTELRVVVSNAGGSATSDAATLSVSSVAPVITRQPRDRSVVEGTAARFDVVTAGTGLAYQWQSAPTATGSFADLPGETAPTLTFAQAALAQNGSHVRVVVSNGAGAVTSTAARLRVSALAAAARVYVTDPSDVTTFDRSIATTAGPDHSATADMGAGTFAASAIALDSSAAVFAGLFQVRLINNTGAPVTIAAGALRAHVEGTYSHPVLPSSSTATSASAFMSVSAQGAGLFTARADHQIGFQYDPDGNVIASVDNFRKVYEQNGATVDLASESPSGLDLDLVMPEIVVGPGVTLFLELQLLTTAQRATSDFTTVPARLTLTLPEGATLDSDAAVPLTWVL